MAKWKLCFVLLLPLIVCFDSEVTLVKTISSEPDVTPICTNATLSPIIFILCKISTVMSSGEECILSYRYAEGFEHGCDSRFTLVAKNQTVFLHLINLTPVDSGDCTCECTHHGGIEIVHLNITVEEDEGTSSYTRILIPNVLIGLTAVLIITGVIFGSICRGIHHGCCSRSATSGLSETPGSLDGDDPYTSLQQPASDLYQTISDSANSTACLHNYEIDGVETDPSCDIYENISSNEST
ncbi:uncharacterized protein LOC125885138 [Epinephelus fuscoguttatus]|uniref:uncharacterized protein LOC125885138 n=1 Tax=Epinephelus fuscoguttatus TaxID=293821 RepID=UPI0020D0DBAF|nr:uncharacterized protein LOC125885138 [Epinephelus fuscoguttatus]